jgi:hypothetical protein
MLDLMEEKIEWLTPSSIEGIFNHLPGKNVPSNETAYWPVAKNLPHCSVHGLAHCDSRTTAFLSSE